MSTRRCHVVHDCCCVNTTCYHQRPVVLRLSRMDIAEIRVNSGRCSKCKFGPTGRECHHQVEALFWC